LLERTAGNAATAEIALPEATGKGEVFLLAYPSGRRAVLRAFKSRTKFSRYSQAMLYCKGKDLPVPQLTESDGRCATRGRFKRWFCVEEFVEGTPLGQLADTSAHAERVLRALARLHGETSARWGWPHKLKQSSFKEYLSSRVNRIFQDISYLSRDVSFGEIGLWHGWLALQIEAMPEPSRFSLVHENLSGDNIIIPPDASCAVFVGSRGLRFGFFAHDVEQILALLAKGDGVKRRDCLALYMRLQNHLPPDANYEALSTVFRARYWLLRLRSLLKRSAKNDAAPGATPDAAPEAASEAAIAQIRKTIRSFVR
jgi:hypothetical protein